MANILVIDDQEDVRELVEMYLTTDNHRVSVAHDGRSALHLLENTIRFDLIITDIVMPNKDGIELITDLLKADSHIPIIAMSGGRRSLTSEFNLSSAEMLGVAATLKKPFSQVVLRQAVNKALSSNR